MAITTYLIISDRKIINMLNSSTYTEGPTQQDGRRYVTERHTEDNGNVHIFEWLGDQDASLVLAARAEELNQQILARAAAAALVNGSKLNLTKLQFRRRFTQQERVLIDDFNENYQAHPALTDDQKKTIRTFLKDFDTAEDVSMQDPDTSNGVYMYASLGIISMERAYEVING